MRGFIGQEATHADAHDAGAPRVHGRQRHRPRSRCSNRSSTCSQRSWRQRLSTDPKRRLNHLCDRLWLIAAIEHYTAVMGDFALNCAWDDHGADPTMVDLFRWHGSEEVEHRSVAHDVAVYFHDSYLDRIRAMTMAVVAIFVFFQRGDVVPGQVRPGRPTSAGGRSSGCACATRKLGLLPKYRKLFGSNTADVLPARIHARRDGFHGAGGRLPRQLPRGPRGTPLMGLLDALPPGCRPARCGRQRHDVLAGPGRRARSRACGRSRAPPGG